MMIKAGQRVAHSLALHVATDGGDAERAEHLHQRAADPRQPLRAALAHAERDDATVRTGVATRRLREKLMQAVTRLWRPGLPPGLPSRLIWSRWGPAQRGWAAQPPAGPPP